MSHPAHPHEADGSVSHDSETREPWLARWWSIPVLAYVLLLVLLLLTITNQTFGR